MSQELLLTREEEEEEKERNGQSQEEKFAAVASFWRGSCLCGVASCQEMRLYGVALNRRNQVEQLKNDAGNVNLKFIHAKRLVCLDLNSFRIEWVASTNLLENFFKKSS